MNWISLLPDFTLLATGVVVLLADARSRDEAGSWPARLAMAGTFAVLVVLLCTRSAGDSGWPAYAVTPQGFWWRLIFTLALLFTQFLSGAYFTEMPNRKAMTRPGAFHALLLFCVSGMFALVSSRDLLTFFLSLELATLPLLALVGFNSQTESSAEAGTKLMVTTGMGTALNLFGMSFLYGASGSLGFASLASAAINPSPLLGLGALLLFGGIGLKITLVPFQMWAPDVYEGAPTPVTAFLAVGSKAAGLAALSLLFFGPLDVFRPRLYPILAIAAIASMVIGNLGAMRQNNLRRFIAYSSIAQAGFFLLAFCGPVSDGRGESALLFNMLAYGAGTLALFVVIRSLGGNAEAVGSLRGLHKERPGLAVLLLLGLFSLAGVPPLAGFMGKFLLFTLPVSQGHYLLVLLGLMNAAWSLYYYLRLVKEAYVPEANTVGGFSTTSFTSWAATGILGATLLLLGLLPGITESLSKLAGAIGK